MILLSIITPHYNMPDSLPKLRDSIPEEPWIEHIVVDDKSDCDAKALAEVKEYVTKRGSIWVDNMTEKKGAGVCRDIGIRQAKGRWVLVADADDFFVDGAFAIISQYLNDEADIIYFTPTGIKVPSGEASERHVPYKKLVEEHVSYTDQKSEMRLRFLFVPDTSKMIRLEMIQNNDVQSSDSIVANDVMFSVRCGYYAKAVRAVGETVYCYTEGEGTLTTVRNKERFRKRLEVYVEQNRFMREHLPAESYSLTCISARGMLRQCLKDYGIRETVRTVRYLRKEHAPINLFAGRIRG